MKRKRFTAFFGTSHTPAAHNRASSQGVSSADRLHGSRFTECPVCGKSVHISLANSHVSRCVDACSSAPQTPGSSAADPHGVDPQTSVLSKKNETEVPHDANPDVPDCQRNPPAATASGPLLSKAVCSVREHDSTADDVLLSKKQKVIKSSPNDAFGRIMIASALSNFREEFYLWVHEDSAVSWGWGPTGCARPAPPNERSTGNSCRRWTCEVATKGPDGRKAGTCEFWTNLPSADTGSIATGSHLGDGVAATGLQGSDDNAVG